MAFGVSTMFPFLTAAVCLLLCGFLLLKYRQQPLLRAVAILLAVAAVVHTANGLWLRFPGSSVLWRQQALLADLWLPVALLNIGLALVEPGTMTARAYRWRMIGSAALALILSVIMWMDDSWSHVSRDAPFVTLGRSARAAYIFVLLSLVLGVAQLEQILRGAAEDVRYRMKFLLLGLGALGSYTIYQAGVVLLVPLWYRSDVVTRAMVDLISISVVAYGLGRARLQSVRQNFFVSPRLLYGSFTFIIVGVYLLGVGVIGELIKSAGHPAAQAVSRVLVFVALLSLVVALFSRRVRSTIRAFTSRHFYRSKYDYRTKWLEVTAAFRGCDSTDAVLERLLQVLANTFGTGRIAVWLHYEADNRFHQTRSINILPPPPPLEMDHPIIVKLHKSEGSVLIVDMPDLGAENAFHGALLFVPIYEAGRLCAFIALGPERRGQSYGEDDRDLLRVISHHVGMLLSLVRLSDERRAATELEALHRFSAFCLHDLKNLTARLSLVVQNAEEHGKDPAFQQSAMKTVAGTVEKMMALMRKLSASANETTGSDHEPVTGTDVHAIIDEVVGSLDGSVPTVFTRAPHPLAVSPITSAQLHQVLMNVIINAQQACEKGGRVHIGTRQDGDAAVITITDTGSGIPALELSRLFRPFRTTKPGGLGIGLYGCKKVIEDCKGRITVASTAHHGTEVRISLPLFGGVLHDEGGTTGEDRKLAPGLDEEHDEHAPQTVGH